MNEVYQHYRKEEKEFINQVYHWLNEVENYYTPYLSHFLTPREALIVQQIVGKRDEVRLAFHGGREGAERQRALLYPSYYEVQADDYALTVLNIKFPTKFGELSHGRILGTLLSTGIDRNRIGDIITDGARWQVMVDRAIHEFLIQQVTKIANVGVHLEMIADEDVLTPLEEWDTQTLIASSLRLDTLIAKVYNFSRQRAKDVLAANLVKVNFVETLQPDFEVGVQDIVSVRKKGRFWVEEIEGTTKKDNYRLKVNIIVK
ncbi:YlmH/Sll1252 family protein [Aerococcaceae bacterium NML180378]|nr:YlmH/Sll1252 family protein [Aerococcaceae bacterium NML171108]MCW6676577.1 YlmH/Sll1252 family protein [Aerococcaceae bacterium NML180378]